MGGPGGASQGRTTTFCHGSFLALSFSLITADHLPSSMATRTPAKVNRPTFPVADTSTPPLMPSTPRSSPIPRQYWGLVRATAGGAAVGNDAQAQQLAGDPK